MTSPASPTSPGNAANPAGPSTEAPLVTIGVPVYNGEAMLGDMLASLEAQTFKRFKVVISDNASTDKTPEIAQAFCARDPRFTYHRNPENIGAAPNWNRAWDIDHATPYYKWAAHDDIYLPTFLERCVEVLEREPDVVLAYPITILVDETGEGRADERLGLQHDVLERFFDDNGNPCWTIGPLHLAEGDDPTKRIAHQVEHKSASFEMYGVIRTCFAERTTLHASYYGSDATVLAQLVLMGKFRQVAEPLYVNRFHRRASRTMKRGDLRTWIDSKGSTRWPRLKMYQEILRAPSVAGLPAPLKLRCQVGLLQAIARLEAWRLLIRVRRIIGNPRRSVLSGGHPKIGSMR